MQVGKFMKDLVVKTPVYAGYKAATGSYGDPRTTKAQISAKKAKYRPYEVSAEEVAKYLPASGLNLPGYTPYQPKGFTITDKEILKSDRARDAEKMRQIQLQVAQAARAENQARLQAAYADINQQIANNQGYGAFQQAQLDRQRLQNIASQNAKWRQRGLQNTTINTDEDINRVYSLANLALQGQLQDRQNQLLANRANFLGGVSNPIPSFNEMATYGQQPGAVYAALASERAQADAARKAKQGAVVSGVSQAVGAGVGLLAGGPPGAMAGYKAGGMFSNLLGYGSQGTYLPPQTYSNYA